MNKNETLTRPKTLEELGNLDRDYSRPPMPIFITIPGGLLVITVDEEENHKVLELKLQN